MVTGIPLPKNVKFKELEAHKGEFTIEPLFPGYGLTIGNAIRRVLLSSLPGAAITAVKIKGVDHEFSTIQHVKEDVVDIILNLKQVRIKVEQDFEEPLKITFSGKGEKEFKAVDFECPSQISIANPDLHIADLTDAAANVEIECRVEQGRGYLPVEAREGDKLEIGNIAIDAYFTPIQKISFKKENVRVGQMTNWDKLILNAETDGTVDCQEAFYYAVNILTEQFNFLNSQGKNKSTVIDQTTDNDENILSTTIESDKNEEDIETQDPKIEDKFKKRGRPKKKID